MKRLNYHGTDAVKDAIEAGYCLESAKKQQKEMINGIERLMRVNHRKNNPIEANRADILPWYYYDRLTAAQASTTATEYKFFVNPISATKTKVDTNMEQVSVLPAPQHFDVTSLQMYFASNMIKADIDTFLNTYVIEFWIGNKEYAEGPIFKFPAGAGLAGTSAVSGQSTYSNGVQNPMAVVDFRMGDNPIGHHILQGQTFYVKMYGTAFTLAATAAGGTGMNILCNLEGILSRGVQ